MTRRTRIILYVIFGAVSLVLSLMITFPWASLGRRMETEFASSVPGASLTIDKIGPSLPMGIYFGGITVHPPGDEELPTPFDVESVRIHPAWSKLLTLKPGVSVDVKALSGKVNASVWRANQALNGDVTLSNLDLESGGFLETQLGALLQGTVSGHVTGTFEAKAPAATKPGQPPSTTPATIQPMEFSEGAIKLTVDGFKVKSGKAMGFTLPVTDLGSPEIAINVTKNEAKIDTFKTKSSDIEAGVTGSISLRPMLMQSMVSGAVKLRPSDDWLARNPLIKSAIGMAGMFKKPDGSLEIPLKGQLAHPINIPGMGHF